MITKGKLIIVGLWVILGKGRGSHSLNTSLDAIYKINLLTKEKKFIKIIT